MSAGSANISASQTQTVEGSATLNGQSATRIAISETIQAPGKPDETFQGINYLRLSEQVVSVVGTSSVFDKGGQAVTQTLSFAPAAPDLDFSLAVGASKTASSTASLSFNPPSKSGSSNGTVVITFEGFETVTVPAGTFQDACRFKLSITTSSAQTITRWIARESGIVLRTVSSTGESQSLAAASINGAPVNAR
ncbi:MAG: hypothetical protein AB7L76_00650 [Burkholderiaceae bacterium]